MFQILSALSQQVRRIFASIKYFIIFLFLLLFIFTTPLSLKIKAVQAADTPLAQLQNFPPGGISHYVRNIRDSYNNLRTYQNNILNNGLPANNTNLSRYLMLINIFTDSLFQPRTPFNHPTDADSQRLSLVLQSAYTNINNFINQYNNNNVIKNSTRSLFSGALERIKNRIRLANIERLIANHQGWMGLGVINNIPDGGNGTLQNIFRDTIQRLTGRIFVIDPNNNNPVIISTSSGMILPRNVMGVIRYDRIITCGHSMKPDNTSPELEIYFARSEILNPRTGLPNSIDISNAINNLGHSAAQADGLNSRQALRDSEDRRLEAFCHCLAADANINIQNFIQYLRHESNNVHSNSVRRISIFQAFSYPNLHNPSIIEHHSPRYRPYQDNGYGHLGNNGFTFLNVQFANINVLDGLPNGVYNYYALGYPGFSYYDTANQSLLVRQKRFSPFTMTRSASNLQKNGQNVLRLVNNKLRHGSPTMKGMSGGPILRFNQNNNTIEILGVIQSGVFENNYGAKFW